MDAEDQARFQARPCDTEGDRVTAGGPLKSDRLRARPLPVAHRRRTARPLAALSRRAPGESRARRAGRLRRWLAGGAMGTVVAALLFAGQLGLAWTLLLVGAGLGVLGSIVPFTIFELVERRQSESDGAVVRAALDVAPLALALIPGLALLPSLRWSLLALPALGLAAAAAGLWWNAPWAAWTWRGSAGLVMGWSALLGLRSLPRLFGPASAADWFSAAAATTAALGLAALGWNLASRLESALASMDGEDPPGPEVDRSSRRADPSAEPES